MTTNDTPTDDDVQRAVVDRVREVDVPGGDPVSEALLEEVTVEDGVVTFTVDFARLDLPLATRVTDQLRGAGLATDGVDHVRIEATEAEAPETGIGISGVETTIAVTSAKGGVGKTTVAVALARALDEAGLDVGLFDANVHAPDAPELLGAEGPVRTTPTGRPMPIDADGIEVLSVELIAEDGPVAWRGAMVHDVVADLLGNADWTDRDVLLIDLPPGIGDGVYTIVQQAPLNGGLLVSSPTNASGRATERSGALLAANDVPTIGVVPNMVGAVDGGDSPYPGASVEDVRIDLEAEVHATIDPIPFDPALREPLSRSFADPDTEGAEAVAALAETVEEFIEEYGGSAAPEDAVDLRGLPSRAREKQALTELVRSEDVSLLIRGEPAELLEIVGETVERDGRRLERAVEDLGHEGWLVRLRVASEARSETPA